MTKPFSVIVVEDEKKTRERLIRVVENSEKFYCAAACADVDSAQRALRKCSPDLLLLDIDLPDGNGLHIIEQLRDRQATTRTVVVTVFEDSRHVMQAIGAGAAGYVLKDDPSISIEQALLVVLQGGAPISPAVARQILDQFNQSPPSLVEKIESLTAREREILVLVSNGFTDKEIARRENISYHTVTTHVKHIYRKLSVKTRVEATRKAIHHGIIESEYD